MHHASRLGFAKNNYIQTLFEKSNAKRKKSGQKIFSF